MAGRKNIGSRLPKKYGCYQPKCNETFLSPNRRNSHSLICSKRKGSRVVLYQEKKLKELAEAGAESGAVVSGAGVSGAEVVKGKQHADASWYEDYVFDFDEEQVVWGDDEDELLGDVQEGQSSTTAVCENTDNFLVGQSSVGENTEGQAIEAVLGSGLQRLSLGGSGTSGCSTPTELVKKTKKIPPSVFKKVKKAVNKKQRNSTEAKEFRKAKY